VLVDPDIFAEWLRRQGHAVIRTTSSYWVESGPRVYQAFPYHWLISPPDEETTKFMLEQKAIALRYSTSLSASTGCLSYHVVYDRENYSEKDLPKKARHDVKKGLSIAIVEPITFSRLATEGWNLRRETLVRQGRSGAETESWWRGLCLSAENLPGFEAWGAIVQGKLVAALLAFSCDSDAYFSILYHQSLTEYLPFGVNNALAYVVTAEVLSRPELKHIFYGLHSLDAPASVDKFKFRMGYIAMPVRQRVDFNPLIRPLVNKASYSILRVGHKALPGNSILAKAEGMFNFYLQGRRPLAGQTRPEPLQDAIFS
jgi:hypothetical protein